MHAVQLLRVAAARLEAAAVVRPLRALVVCVQHHTLNFAFLPLENFKFNPYN